MKQLTIPALLALFCGVSSSASARPLVRYCSVAAWRSEGASAVRSTTDPKVDPCVEALLAAPGATHYVRGSYDPCAPYAATVSVQCFRGGENVVTDVGGSRLDTAIQNALGSEAYRGGACLLHVSRCDDPHRFPVKTGDNGIVMSSTHLKEMNANMQALQAQVSAINDKIRPDTVIPNLKVQTVSIAKPICVPGRRYPRAERIRRMRGMTASPPCDPSPTLVVSLPVPADVQKKLFEQELAGAPSRGDLGESSEDSWTLGDETYLAATLGYTMHADRGGNSESRVNLDAFLLGYSATIVSASLDTTRKTVETPSRREEKLHYEGRVSVLGNTVMSVIKDATVVSRVHENPKDEERKLYSKSMTIAIGVVPVTLIGEIVGRIGYESAEARLDQDPRTGSVAYDASILPRVSLTGKFTAQLAPDAPAFELAPNVGVTASADFMKATTRAHVFGSDRGPKGCLQMQLRDVTAMDGRIVAWARWPGLSTDFVRNVVATCDESVEFLEKMGGEAAKVVHKTLEDLRAEAKKAGLPTDVNIKLPPLPTEVPVIDTNVEFPSVDIGGFGLTSSEATGSFALASGEDVGNLAHSVCQRAEGLTDDALKNVGSGEAQMNLIDWHGVTIAGERDWVNTCKQ